MWSPSLCTNAPFRSKVGAVVVYDCGVCVCVCVCMSVHVPLQVCGEECFLREWECCEGVG